MFLDRRFNNISWELERSFAFSAQGRRDGGIPVCGKSNFLVTTDTMDVLSR